MAFRTSRPGLNGGNWIGLHDIWCTPIAPIRFVNLLFGIWLHTLLATVANCGVLPFAQSVQHLLLEITLEFDRFASEASVLPKSSKWSQLVLKRSVDYALTLLGSASILTDHQTRHDLKSCGYGTFEPCEPSLSTLHTFVHVQPLAWSSNTCSKQTTPVSKCRLLWIVYPLSP